MNLNLHKQILLFSSFCVIILFSCSQNNFPSEEETENFCLIIEDAINNNSSGFINKIFDTEPLIENITKDIDAPEDYENGFIQGFQQAYSLGDVMAASTYNEGYSKFLRLKKYTPDTIIALYRIVSEAGLNYQELYLKPNEAGELHVFDLYSYAEGDLFSESIKRLYVINLATESPDFSHPLAENLPAINEIAALADKEKYAEAFQKLEALPEEVKQEKIVQMIRLNLANDISVATLNTVAEDFKQKFPEDNLVYLKMMELAFVRQDLPSILTSIDSLDKKVLGDAYLKVIKAGVYRDNAQDKLAEKLVLEAIAQEPDNDDGYWLLLDMFIIQKRHTEAINLFGQIKEQFGENAAEYIVYDGYEEFYQSAEFKNWLAQNPIDSTSTMMNESFDIDKFYDEYMEEHNHHDHSGHDHDSHDHSGHNH